MNQGPGVERRRRLEERFHDGHMWHVLRIHGDVMFPMAVRRRVSLSRVGPRLHTWRRQHRPAHPQSYLRMQEMTQGEDGQQLLRHDEGTVYLNCITAADGRSSVVYGDAGVIALIPELQWLDLSTSTVTLPDLANTCSILMVTGVSDAFAFTFGWAWLNEVTPELLREIMAFIRRELIPNDVPASINTNLDWRLRESIQQEWLDVPLTFTFHQFCLTLLHRADLDANIDFENERHMMILKKLLALALLPEEDILTAFEWIRRVMPINMRMTFRNYLMWYHQFIILGLTPRVMSFFDRPALLNDLTSRVPMNLSARVNSQVARPWDSFQTTLRIAAASTSDLRRLREGGPGIRDNITMSPRVHGSVNLPEINRLWNLRRTERVTSRRFLAIAANTISEFIGVTLFRGEFRAGEFEPVHRPPPDDNIPDFDFQGPDPDPQELFMEINSEELRIILRREFGRRFLPIGEIPEEFVPFMADEEEEEVADPMIEYEWRCSKCGLNKMEMISKPCNCLSICRPCEQVMRQEAQDDAAPLTCPACQGRAVTYERVFISENNDADVPYNFRCQICEVNPISSMGRFCHHLMICTACVVRMEAVQRHSRCPVCRRGGGFTRVHFRNAGNPQ